MNSFSYRHSFKNEFSALIGAEHYDHILLLPDIIDGPVIGNFPYLMYKQTMNKLNMVAGIKYEQNWGALTALYAHDGNYKENSYKLRLDTNVSNRMHLFALAAYKNIKSINNLGFPDEHNFYTILIKNLNALSPYGDWDGKWKAMIGGSYLMRPDLIFNTQLGYTQAKTFSLTANLNYNLAKNFYITPEISYPSWGKKLLSQYPEYYDPDGDLPNALYDKHSVRTMVKLSYKF